VSPQAFNVIYLGLVILAVLLVFAVCERIRSSPYGRVLRAIRDDDQVAAAAGKRVIAFKTEALAVSAAILGLAGALWGHYTSFIAPDVFTPLVTIYVVLALTAGGTGNNVGAIVGAVLVIALLEGTRFASGWLIGLRPVQIAALREALIGVGLLVVLRLRPRGLVPERIVPVARPR
jgi:branched-chain amino acid transport system permease protein